MNNPSNSRGPSSPSASPRDHLLELGLEPDRLERNVAPGDSPESTRLGSLARKLFLAALPALAVPACVDSSIDRDTSIGLDNGTVGKVVPAVPDVRDRAA